MPSRLPCTLSLHMTCNVFFLLASHITFLHSPQHCLRVSTRISFKRCRYLLTTLNRLRCCKGCQYSVHYNSEFLEFGATFIVFYGTYIQYRIGLLCTAFPYCIVIIVHLLLLHLFYCYFKIICSRSNL